MSHRLTKVYICTYSIHFQKFVQWKCSSIYWALNALLLAGLARCSLFVPFFRSSFLQWMRRQQIAKKLGDSKQSAIIWSTQKRILLRSLGAESTKNPTTLDFFSLFCVTTARLNQTSCGFFFTQNCAESPSNLSSWHQVPLASKAGGFNQPNTLHC